MTITGKLGEKGKSKEKRGREEKCRRDSTAKERQPIDLEMPETAQTVVV